MLRKTTLAKESLSLCQHAHFRLLSITNFLTLNRREGGTRGGVNVWCCERMWRLTEVQTPRGLNDMAEEWEEIYCHKQQHNCRNTQVQKNPGYVRVRNKEEKMKNLKSSHRSTTNRPEGVSQRTCFDYNSQKCQSAFPIVAFLLQSTPICCI